MNKDELVEKLAQKLYAQRPTVKHGIWWFGIPNIKPITISLRGQLRERGDKYVWLPDEPERASCCEGYEDEEAKEHCMTLEHIRTMLHENYTLEELQQQLELYDLITIICLRLDSDGT